MKVTLELSEEEQQWIESQPEGIQLVHKMIRAQMDYERRLATRYSPETLEIVRKAQERAEQLRNQGITHEEAVDRFTSLLSEASSSQNAQ